MTFLIFFAAAILFVGVAFAQTSRKASRLSRLSWEDLVASLEPVPAGGIATVARDYLQPRMNQLEIETDQLWDLIGGAEGLRRMNGNAEVLIALAGYAQRWNPGEGIIVAERMRRDGVALRRATRRLWIGLLFGYGRVRGPFSLQEAASAYYLMRERLLALYQTSHAGRYPMLAAAM